nr:hypothetical protein [Acinetobacter sp.]
MDSETIFGIGFLFIFLFSTLSFSMTNYYLYQYLIKRKLVEGYWDFNAYVYGNKNWKRYCIIFKAENRYDSDLKKAKVYLIMYYLFMVSIFVLVGFAISG